MVATTKGLFMSPYALAFFLLSTAATAASGAEPIDPCSLLTEGEMNEIGVPTGTAPIRDIQSGGVQYCKYQAQSPTGQSVNVSIILSVGVPDRALQLRALQTKARTESTEEQLKVRGEYYVEGAMCKVLPSPQAETDQCIGSTDRSVVGLALTRPNAANGATYPSLQLKLISTLVSRVSALGG